MNRPRRKRGCLLLLIVLAGGLLLWRGLATKSKRTVISPIPETTQTRRNPFFSLFRHKKNAGELANKVNSVINGQWSDYSVYVEDYTSDFTMGLAERETYTAASVNKVPILAALYYQADHGAIDLDRDITLQQEEIQDYGTGSLRYDKPGTTYSIKTLARLMIKQSDNTAAYILGNEIIGFSTLTQLVSQWGLTQTDMTNNKTSNKDTATLFRMIYDGKIAGPAATQEMLSFLKDTDFENRLPATLPDTVAVYHKIGTETGIIHDAGVITDKTTTYYLGVFTNDEKNDAATEALIAKVSKVVYDYMRS